MDDDRIIDRAIARGIYVTIDWHQLSPGDPMFNLARARTYFTHMTQKYGHLPNVVYEICNEPSGVSWARIKEYANQIIPTIRNIDPDGKDVCEVGQHGQPVPCVTKGWLRASHRKLDKEKSLPYRPYHAHDERWWLRREYRVRLSASGGYLVADLSPARAFFAGAACRGRLT